jgi:hypothetical protein
MALLGAEIELRFCPKLEVILTGGRRLGNLGVALWFFAA